MSKTSRLSGALRSMPSPVAARVTRGRCCWPWTFAALLCSGAAQAHEQRGPDFPGHEIEVAFFAGQTFGGGFEDPNDDSEQDVNSAPSVGLIFDFEAQEPDSYYEILYSYQSTDVDGMPELDLDIEYFHIGGRVDYIQDNLRAIPFVAAGLGATVFSPKRSGFDSEMDFSVSLALGLKLPITQRIALRLEARAFLTFQNSNSDIFCSSTAAGGACNIRTSSESFAQYTAGIGITAGF